MTMMWNILICLSLMVVTTKQHSNQAYPPGVPPPGNQQHMHQQPPANQGQQQYQGQQQQYQQNQGQQHQQNQGQQHQQNQGQQQYQGQNQQYQGQQQQNTQYQNNQQPPPQGHQANTQQFQQPPPNSFNQRENVHNQEHIKEHLKEVVDKPEKEMTDDELEFHYFKLHDYDGNNKLDGVEVAKAITHFHDEDEANVENKPPPKVYTDDELVNIIDMVMKEDDLNNDGYIEYFEFVTAQRKLKDDNKS